MNLKAFLSVSAIVAVSSAHAAWDFTGSLLTQDFDTLAQTGTTNAWSNDTTLVGWYGYRYAGTGSGNPQNVTQYVASDGSSNTGALFSMGSTGSSDRGLGVVSSGTNVLEFGVAIKNATGADLKSLIVTFDGEQWRDSTSTKNKLDFTYSTDATSLSTGTWVDVDSLDVIGHDPVTGTNGAIAGGANLGTYSALITFNTPVAAGNTVWFRWQDANDVGNDAMIGIDNFQAVPEPASMVALGLGAAALVRRRRSAK